MKKSLPILCIALILFNSYGYYAIFCGLQYSHDRSFTRTLDAGAYNTSQTHTFAIPLTMPYVTDDRGFERADGRFFYEGDCYRLVKQRLSMDTLFLVCVKDIQTRHLRNALSRHTRSLSGAPAGEKSTLRFAGIAGEYYGTGFALELTALGWENSIDSKSPHIFFATGYHTAVHQPPEIG